jgi:hypothetical protein
MDVSKGTTRRTRGVWRDDDDMMTSWVAVSNRSG